MAADDANLVPVAHSVRQGLLLDSAFIRLVLQSCVCSISMRRRCISLISSTTSASSAPSRRRHSRANRAKGPTSRLSSQFRAVREGAAPVASCQAIESNMMKFRSASRLAKFRRGSGARSSGRHVGRDCLPDGRRRPATNRPPNWQSRTTISPAPWRRAGSRSASGAGSEIPTVTPRSFSMSRA